MLDGADILHYYVGVEVGWRGDDHTRMKGRALNDYTCRSFDGAAGTEFSFIASRFGETSGIVYCCKSPVAEGESIITLRNLHFPFMGRSDSDRYTGAAEITLEAV